MKELSYGWKRSIKSKKGIICGADEAQEWLLPWWWERYRDQNDYPVTFCDFGMSESMRQWCEERGDVVSVTINPTLIADREKLDPALIDRVDQFKEYFLNGRKQWFKKPFAFLQSEYEVGIWLDLDCEVLGSLEPLFSLSPLYSTGMAMVRAPESFHLPPLDPRVVYNSGVVVFNHGSALVEHWAKASIEINHRFLSDDYLLSHLIHFHASPVEELPPNYNWRMGEGFNLSAVIIHWLGSGGKDYIRNEGGLKPRLASYGFK